MKLIMREGLDEWQFNWNEEVYQTGNIILKCEYNIISLSENVTGKHRTPCDITFLFNNQEIRLIIDIFGCPIFYF